MCESTKSKSVISDFGFFGMKSDMILVELTYFKLFVSQTDVDSKDLFVKLAAQQAMMAL